MTYRDPESKGENWPKFLKEMQRLGPALSETRTPQNRAEARSNGRKSIDDFLTREMSRLADVEKFRAYKVNLWFDENMQRLAPRIMGLLKRFPRRTSLIRLAGYKLNAIDSRENGAPFTLCTIRRFGRLKAGLRMFWEDPKKVGVLHVRR